MADGQRGDAGHGPGVVVLDDERRGMPPEDGTKLACAAGVERGARRVLRARRQDERLHAGAERPPERVGTWARVVDRDRLGDEAERGDEVEHGDVARILERDAVTGPELRLKDALDPVERAADDRERTGREAVRVELAAGDLEKLRAIRRLAVQAGTPPHAGERARERRQQRRVGVAEREVAQVRRCGRHRTDRQRRPGAHARAAPPLCVHEPAHAEGAVGGGHGGRAHAERAREIADRRQGGAGGETSLADRRFHARDDPSCTTCADSILCHYVHQFVL